MKLHTKTVNYIDSSPLKSIVDVAESRLNALFAP
ncbi:MAG: hypothetical protein JWM55_1306 [Acidimicrobiaceae bacterium]|nr:hypothetical protein [Acidimicrobiaceae bacterium]